jgi:NADPH:quinone reductase
MKQVIVERFGGPEVLQVRTSDTPMPGVEQVRVRITSIGMNHADLMARQGRYRLASGDPPFTPGLEAGGVIDAIGPHVNARHLNQRVILGVDIPRGAQGGGTYRSHFICPVEWTVPAPASIPDEQLGGIWLPYLTAWGCLVWKQRIGAGDVVVIPAASSSVGLAAAQVARENGARTIGLTSHPEKVEVLRSMAEAPFDYLICTRDFDWPVEIMKLTDGRGADGSYLDKEIRALAKHGTIWVYGLLGKPDVVDVSPLIRRYGAIRGWLLYELVEAGPNVLQQAYQHVLDGLTRSIYKQRIARTFKLDDVHEAHRTMERGEHIGKLVLVP